MLAACGDGTQSAEPPSIEVVSMPVSGGTALDVLLVIDDSASVAHMQVALAEHIDTLFGSLQSAAGGSLDLHLGVTTSDYGTAAMQDPLHPGPPIGQLGNGGCAGVGKDGALITNGAPVTDHYLVDGTVTNYTGARRDALHTMILVGAGGCGFEQPLAASVRAFANPANTGFRRDDANLLVLFMQDEDDCTLLDPALLGPESAELGPVQSFRCTRFGVRCDEDVSTLGEKHHCAAREDSPYVIGIDALPETYRSLVRDASRLVLGVLAGPPSPLTVGQRTPPGGGTPIAALDHSCQWIGPMGELAVADPPVRMRSLVEAMGAHGAMASVCSQDLRPSLTELGRVAKQMFGVACLDTTKLRDSDTLAGVQPTCSAVVVTDGVEEPLPACPAAGACFELVADPAACAETADHLRFVAHDAPAGAYLRARCEVP